MIKSEVVPRNVVKWDRIKMHYCYIIQNLKDKTFYIGSTANLRERFKQHNNKKSRYSSTKVPFKLVWYGALDLNLPIC